MKARAAIVHDWFQGMHGSERVVDALLDVFEECPDVYTFHAAHAVLPTRLSQAIKKESRLAALPGIRQTATSPGKWRGLLPYMPHYFGRLKLVGYDVVISSAHACAAGVQTPADAFHACYCHAPMRYVWTPEIDTHRASGARGLALAAIRGYLRKQDLRASKRPDAYIANSTAVAARIGEFYGREAAVIPPPVAIDDFRADCARDDSHFLWVHRFVPYKRPQEVAAAFAALPDLRLTMVGVGPLEKEVRRRLPPNVDVRGWMNRDELAGLYNRCGGFIHIGEEDFGISMVEALAAGAPVVALARGGAKDIVQENETGVFINDPSDAQELIEAIQRVAERRWDPNVLRARADSFSEEAFRTRIARFLTSHGV